MLFFEFFFALVIGSIVFRFIASLVMSPIMFGVKHYAEKAEKRDGEHLSAGTWGLIVLGICVSIGLASLWAAGLSKVAVAYSSRPEVVHHWLYYITGLCCCAATVGNDDGTSNLPSIVAVGVYIVLCRLA